LKVAAGKNPVVDVAIPFIMGIRNIKLKISFFNNTII
jgi:hypothetical protein